MMKRWLGSIACGLIVIAAGYYVWIHLRHAPAQKSGTGTPVFDETTEYAEQKAAHEAVTFTGPLVNYMSHEKPGQIETIQPAVYKPISADHVGDSPVGTSVTLIRQTFRLGVIVDVPFELPPHASTPHLHGTYDAFTKGTAQTSDPGAIEFLLLNERQYSDFLNDRPGEALFSADAAPSGEVNVTLPPTFGHAAKYYLVFRNASVKPQKQAVNANFQLDF